MNPDTVLVFTQNGLGNAPEDLQRNLALKFLTLMQESKQLPSKILFYTNGVKLACKGSPVISILQELETQRVELVLCKTCLDYFNLTDQVEVGIVGGMGDVLEVLQKAEKVVSL